MNENANCGGRAIGDYRRGAFQVSSTHTKLRIGFIPLADAAALIVAADKGFATAEGLDVELVREVSWSNVRDKLNIGLFDAAHLIAPIAIALIAQRNRELPSEGLRGNVRQVDAVELLPRQLAAAFAVGDIAVDHVVGRRPDDREQIPRDRAANRATDASEVQCRAQRESPLQPPQPASPGCPRQGCLAAAGGRFACGR